MSNSDVIAAQLENQNTASGFKNLASSSRSMSIDGKSLRNEQATLNEQ